MLTLGNHLLFSQQYIPHGHCYLWQPRLVGLHFFSDVLIALAYYSIPLILLYFVRQRENIPFRKIFVLFSLFILTCGTTHLMAVWTLWHPSYWLAGALKAVTALISCYTALELIPVIPQALALPNPQVLEQTNQQLAAEIEERQEAEVALQYQLAFDRLVSRISSRFVNLAAAKVTEGIKQALEEIGEFMGVETSYLFRLSGDRANFSMTSEWIAPGFKPQLEKAQDLPVLAFPWSTTQLLHGEIVHVPSIKTLPEAAAVDREHWQRFQLQSLISVPLSDRGRVLGWIGFASFSEEKVWSPSSIQLLSIFGELLTNTLQRQQAEAELAQLYQELEAKVAKRTADLRESEQQFRSLFEAAPDLIYILDLEGTIQQVNPATVKSLGYGAGELRGDRLENFLVPSMRDVSSKTFTSVLQGNTHRQELEFARKDGSILTADCSCTVVGAEQVKDPYILVVQRDISDRKFLEQQLRTSEGKMRAVFEAMSDLVLAISLPGDRVPQINIAPTHLVYSSESNIALIDQTIAELLQSENHEWLETVRQVLKTQQTVHFDYGLTVNGRDLCFAASISPMSENSVVWVARDITERHQAEQAIRESEARFHMLADSVPVLIWMSGVDALCNFFNKPWLEFTGRNLPQELGNGWVENLHPDDSQACLQTYRSAFAARSSFSMEYRLRRADGEYRWMIDRGIPRFTPEGDFAGFIGSCLDISDRKQAEAQLQQLNQELRRSNKELEQFAYIASHDLREPLRMVTSFTKLLAQRYSGQLDSEADTLINFAVDGATRMQILIEDLLAYSRVGRIGNSFEVVDCEAVKESAIANLRLLVQETGTKIATTPLPSVMGDRAQLVQLFQNLIDNAIKYCNEPTPEIEIGAKLQEDLWLFWVGDNGIGIEPQYAQRIFLIFQRLHARKEYSGTGIGLAICQKIVDRHRGRIWVESELARGSTFYFTLPIYT